MNLYEILAELTAGPTGINFKALFAERDKLTDEVHKAKQKYDTYVANIPYYRQTIYDKIAKLEDELDDIRRDMEMDPEVKPSEGHSGTRGGYYGDLMNAIDEKQMKLHASIKSLDDKSDELWSNVDKAWNKLETHKKKIKKAFDKIK